MNTRSFGDTHVGEIGLGCWQLGGDWGKVDDGDALATLRAAQEAGVTFFDTADVYGGGRSERLIGQFLKETDAPPFVATKLGRRGDPGWPGNFAPDVLRRHTEDSLRNLGVERLDLTQLHCIPTDVLRDGAVFDLLRQLRSEGKIARFGASVETVEEGLICLEQDGITSLQIIFNLFRQLPLDELLPRAKERGVALIVRLPLASGLLSGKFRADTQFAPEDHRTYNRNGEAFNVGETFAGLPFETGVRLADELKAYVPPGMSLAEMSLRWCLDFDAISVLIPGAKHAEQARANARVSDLPPLPADLHQRLQQFYRASVADHIRGPY